MGYQFHFHSYMLNDFEQVTYSLWASASAYENEGQTTHVMMGGPSGAYWHAGALHKH